MNNRTGVESLAVGAVLKHGWNGVSKFMPHLKIVFSLILVRLGLRNSVSFKMKYMRTASKWSDRLGVGRTRQHTFQFPGGIKMHRAYGIPEFDNSTSRTVMSFKPR